MIRIWLTLAVRARASHFWRPACRKELYLVGDRSALELIELDVTIESAQDRARSCLLPEAASSPGRVMILTNAASWPATKVGTPNTE